MRESQWCVPFHLVNHSGDSPPSYTAARLPVRETVAGVAPVFGPDVHRERERDREWR
ncbi:hypothetical protein Hanom_Chr07g00618911 [Helianthus anomalus]